jgi:hypothetical protein
MAGAARTEPYDAAVSQETDVRCGRGDGAMFYVTNHLRVGDRVRVVKEEDGGWLAIVPPSGSFSWIRKDLLQDVDDKQPPYTFVKAEAADVRIGSALTKEPPLVIGKHAVQGTLVTRLPNGVEKADNEGTWIPIYPPDGELRYIRAEAVQKPAAATPATVVAGPPSASPQTQDAATLYRRALDAEKYDPQQAITLYNQGAAVDANPDRRVQALNRANWLHDNLRNPAQTIMPGAAPGADLRMAAAPTESKVYALTADSSATPTAHLASPQAPGAATTNSSAPWPTPGAGKEYATHPGWLHLSGRAVEGRKTYLMTTDNGSPLYYVTAQPGVNLDAYLNHRIECFGDAIYNGDLRANYMRVSRVETREGQ